MSLEGRREMSFFSGSGSSRGMGFWQQRVLAETSRTPCSSASQQLYGCVAALLQQVFLAASKV